MFAHTSGRINPRPCFWSTSQRVNDRDKGLLTWVRRCSLLVMISVEICSYVGDSSDGRLFMFNIILVSCSPVTWGPGAWPRREATEGRAIERMNDNTRSCRSPVDGRTPLHMKTACTPHPLAHHRAWALYGLYFISTDGAHGVQSHGEHGVTTKPHGKNLLGRIWNCIIIFIRSFVCHIIIRHSRKFITRLDVRRMSLSPGIYR